MFDVGVLALRLALGAVFLAHGAQKAFGAFGGPGFQGATGFIGSMGFRPARFWTALAVGGELVAGVLFLLGLLTSLAGLLVLATIPAGVVGVLFEHYIETTLRSPFLIAFTANSTHSILGTAAAMDIGGAKMAGFTSGLIDSFQYFGGSLAGFFLGELLACQLAQLLVDQRQELRGSLWIAAFNGG